MSSRGFTLIEVVVAFAVLTLCLGALYPVFASASRRAILAQDYAQAVAVAESRLAEAGVSESLAGSVGAGNAGRFAWERSVAPFVPGAWRITVEVRWDHDGAQRSISLTTVRMGGPP